MKFNLTQADDRLTWGGEITVDGNGQIQISIYRDLLGNQGLIGYNAVSVQPHTTDVEELCDNLRKAVRQSRKIQRKQKG